MHLKYCLHICSSHNKGTFSELKLQMVYIVLHANSKQEECWITNLFVCGVDFHFEQIVINA
jgi:hypothetical protein